MIWYLGFLRRGQFIGERATRGGGPPVQVGPRRGLDVDRAWVLSGACGPPQVSLGRSLCFFVKIKLVNFELIPRNFPEQLF